MKTLSSLLLPVCFLCLTVSAQNKISDREKDGLFGQVKSVYNNYQYLDKNAVAVDKLKCFFCSETIYDSDGKFVKDIYHEMNYFWTKNIIDGFETYKSEEIVKMPPYNGFFSTVVPKEEPIELPEKITGRDQRYTYKYVYEYDDADRIKVKRTFQNDGKLIGKSTYYYDNKNKIIAEINISLTNENQMTFKYDEKGNLIEQTTNSKSRTGGTDSKATNIYSGYKFDSNGNWIERTETTINELINSPIKYEDGRSKSESKKIETRKIIYY